MLFRSTITLLQFMQKVKHDFQAANQEKWKQSDEIQAIDMVEGLVDLIVKLRQ